MRIVRHVLIVAAYLNVATAVAQESEPPAPPTDSAGAEPTPEARLKILPISEHVLRGRPPEGEDCAFLAREKGVTRIICLLDEAEIPQEERQRAEQAGIEFERLPIAADAAATSEQRRINREATLKVIDRLRSAREGMTYVHCSQDGTRSGAIDFAFGVLVNHEGYAEALLRVLGRGLTLGGHSGLLVDMKLLASGLDELPVVQGIPISDADLLSRGELVSVAGARLHVKKLGQGPAVYCIHGGPGETHTPFRPYFDPLAERFTVVYHDQRGCGYSSKPQFKEAYTLDRSAEDLENLRVQLGHDRISLLAHSSGGAVALKYALAHRERVNKLVILSSWASAQEFSRFVLLPRAMMTPQEAEFFTGIQEKCRTERRLPNDREMSDLARLAYPTNFFGVMEPRFQADWSRRADVSSLAHTAMAAELFGSFDVRPQLGQLAGIPTLVMTGRFDVLTPPAVVRTIADGIDGARFEVFERSGHFVFVEEHKKFIDLVSAFLAGEGEQSPPAAPSG